MWQIIKTYYDVQVDPNYFSHTDNEYEVDNTSTLGDFNFKNSYYKRNKNI